MKSPKCTRSQWETVMKSVKHTLTKMMCSCFTKNKEWKSSVVTEHIKITQDILLIHLVKWFNAIMDAECYPQQFKRGVTITLFKGGNKDKLDMNSYRDITLMSILQKLFENKLYTRLQNYSSEIAFPHPLQQGFRPGCGSITAAFVLSETVNHIRHRKNVINVRLKNYNAVILVNKHFPIV